ncbi:ergosterol biosynthesis protein [Polyrhizophydium stewartii]|uniref:Ergosterol biosynthesis protein n=1 Tax=Polyrhizophydium stewartii TaxID=2732419 RepID=A0ABR4NHU9_9FUNG|nr:ergosterol biosynthesis protein [Polyrhizophydium stewartii]
MTAAASWFPSGALERTLLVVGSLAIYNGIQGFVPQMRVTSRIYARQPGQVTPLMSRMMSTWTITSAIVRLYAAYNIHNEAVYQMCMWTFVLALGSFFSEVFVYRTAPISSPGVFPALIISTSLLTWMATSYSTYITA